MRKFDGCTRSHSAVAGPVAAVKSASRVRLVVPTSRSDRARLRQHVGNAEAAADLDQFAARDQHLAAAGQPRQRQQHGGGVVVDDDRRLGAGDRGEQALGVHRARAAAGQPAGRTRASNNRGRRRRRGPARASASGARPRLVWITTPVAFTTGRSVPCAAAPSRARSVALERPAERSSRSGAGGAGRGRRAVCRHARAQCRHRRVAPVPRDQHAHARTLQQCVDRGQDAEIGHLAGGGGSGYHRLLMGRVRRRAMSVRDARRSRLRPCGACPDPPATRTLLAVRGAQRGPERRRARRPRSRSARGAVRQPQPAVLGHAGVPALRRRSATTRRCARPGRRPSTARSAAATSAATGRASSRRTRRRCAISTCWSATCRRPTCCSTTGRCRSRASCGCRCCGCSCSGSDVPPNTTERVRSAAARARSGAEEARGRIQPVLRRPAAEAAVGDPVAGRGVDQALRPAADPEHRRALPLPGPAVALQRVLRAVGAHPQVAGGQPAGRARTQCSRAAASPGRTAARARDGGRRRRQRADRR